MPWNVNHFPQLCPSFQSNRARELYRGRTTLIDEPGMSRGLGGIRHSLASVGDERNGVRYG
jgi:hypothetical protein